jgi:aryl-alcohol dehydrogenase-like predicted oxidoreductase
VAAGKYDKTKDADMGIVNRVSELAKKHNCTMTQIALAWHFAKGVTSPLIGATKAEYFDDAAGSFDISLSREDIEYLEELYTAHNVVGAI